MQIFYLLCIRSVNYYRHLQRSNLTTSNTIWEGFSYLKGEGAKHFRPGGGGTLPYKSDEGDRQKF